MRGPLDVIFLRNVMIYFNVALRQKVISEMQRLLSEDGLLFIGHAESLLGVSHELYSVRPSVYSKKRRSL
jgi:chemotaxis protein methyltransferase CheR